MLKKYAILALTLLALTGCFEKKIDGTTQETYERSLQEIRRTITVQEQQKLDDALQVIAMSNVENLGDVMLMVAKPDRYETFLRQRVDGKTAKQIIAEADQLVKAKGEKPNATTNP